MVDIQTMNTGRTRPGSAVLLRGVQRTGGAPRTPPPPPLCPPSPPPPPRFIKLLNSFVTRHNQGLQVSPRIRREIHYVLFDKNDSVTLWYFIKRYVLFD